MKKEERKIWMKNFSFFLIFFLNCCFSFSQIFSLRKSIELVENGVTVDTFVRKNRLEITEYTFARDTIFITEQDTIKDTLITSFDSLLKNSAVELKYVHYKVSQQTIVVRGKIKRQRSGKKTDLPSSSMIGIRFPTERK